MSRDSTYRAEFHISIYSCQIENEFGTYAVNRHLCDHDYLSHLARMARRHLGRETVLFSTDNAEVSHLR